MPEINENEEIKTIAPHNTPLRALLMPVEYRLAVSVPSLDFINKLLQLYILNHSLAQETLWALKEIYYPVTQRKGEPDTVSITAAIALEANSNQAIRDSFHHHKAAAILNVIANCSAKLKSFKRALTTDGDLALVDEFVNYLDAQFHVLKKQLEKIPPQRYQTIKPLLIKCNQKYREPISEDKINQAASHHAEVLTKTPYKKLTDRSKIFRKEFEKIEAQIISGKIIDNKDLITSQAEDLQPGVTDINRAALTPSPDSDKENSGKQGTKRKKSSARGTEVDATVSVVETVTPPVVFRVEPAKKISFSFKSTSHKKLNSFHLFADAVDEGNKKSEEVSKLDLITNEKTAVQKTKACRTLKF